MSVFVLDRKGKPLMPCSEARARKLLAVGRARVHRVMPFAIRLTDRFQADGALQPLRLKLDPGSKITGLALVRESQTLDLSTGEIERNAAVVSLVEIIHRGRQISKALTARRQMRRRRRNQLRYRAPRFLNRGGDKKGWLAPSLMHRVHTTVAWVQRIQRWAPITSISQELVRFDMQKIQAQAQGREISGVEYQQGALYGFEVKEYLLEKFNRTCMYCDAKDAPLEREHLVPSSKGGSNRISNLGLACHCCNQKKGAKSLEEFVKDKARLLRIKAQVKTPLKDAAAVNATRWALANALKATGLPLELSSGGRTKFNRSRLSIPKSHALDAACVGEVEAVTGWQRPALQVKCTGRGCYQRTQLDRFGFPRGYLTRKKRVFGFQTGDRVSATVARGKNAGTHTGRVAVRATGSFDIQTGSAVVQGIGYRHCRLIRRGDGYGYSQLKIALAPKGCGNQGAASQPALSLLPMNGEVSRAD